jgi:hypothetical protein
VVFGLAAVGLVTIVRTVQKGVKRLLSRGSRLQIASAPVEAMAPAWGGRGTVDRAS